MITNKLKEEKSRIELPQQKDISEISKENNNEPKTVLKVKEINEPKEIEKNIISERKNYFTGKELLEMEIEVLPTLLDPIFPKKGLIALGGSSDTGKSSLLRHFAISLVTNKELFLNFRIISTNSKALYYSTEDDELSISYQINKIKEEFEDPELLSNVKFIFDQSDVIADLNKHLKKESVDVVIIDAFADLFPGNLNSANEVRTFLNKFQHLSNKYDCLIIFLHHTGKRTESQTPSKNNLLGSQGFEAKMRMVMELRKDPDDTSIRHLCIVKGNYLSEEFKTRSYVLKFDEKQLFHNTDERIEFEELIKDDERDYKRSESIKRAIKLHEEGKTYIQIADILYPFGQLGIDLSY